MPLRLTVTEEQRSFVSPHAPGHPLFAALTGYTLGHWRHYPAALRSGYAKPTTGRFRVLAGASGGRWVGSPTAAVTEVLEGRGRYVLCQVELIGHYGHEPEATLLTHNLLAWASQETAAGEARECALVHGESEALVVALREATGRSPAAGGLSALKAARGDVAVIMATGPMEDLIRQKEALESFVNEGGVVLCVGAAAATWSDAWLPSSAHIAAPSESRYVLPARESQVAQGETGLLWGVPATDLSANDIWDQKPRVRDPFTEWDPAWKVVAWAGPPWTGDRSADYLATPACDRAAILQLRHGKGRYVLAQALLIPTPSPYSAAGTEARRRAFRTVLTNLGMP